MSEKQTNNVTAGSVPAQIPNFELKKTPCCYFLKEKEQGTMIKLNDSSALIWQVCTGEWAVGEIIDVLKESYPDAVESMEKDVYQALDMLINEGAIALTS